MTEAAFIFRFHMQSSSRENVRRMSYARMTVVRLLSESQVELLRTNTDRSTLLSNSSQDICEEVGSGMNDEGHIKFNLLNLVWRSWEHFER